MGYLEWVLKRKRKYFFSRQSLDCRKLTVKNTLNLSLTNLHWHQVKKHFLQNQTYNNKSLFGLKLFLWMLQFKLMARFTKIPKIILNILKLVKEINYILLYWRQPKAIVFKYTFLAARNVRVWAPKQDCRIGYFGSTKF